jgi:hypothetical protein
MRKGLPKKCFRKILGIGWLKGVMGKKTNVFREFLLIGLLVVACEAEGQTYDFSAQISHSGNYTAPVTNSVVNVLGEPARFEPPRVFGINLTLRSEIGDVKFFGSSAAAGGGHYAYVAGNSRNHEDEIFPALWVFDIADANHPTMVGLLRSSEPVADPIRPALRLVGNKLYCASFGGLRIIDVSDPKSPKFASDFLDLGAIRYMAANGNYLYLAADNTLRVLDVSSSAAPSLVSQLEFPSTIGGLQISGSNVFLNIGWALWVIDVSEPRSPRKVANYVREAGGVAGLAVAGNFAFLLGVPNNSYDYSIDVVDISDPAHPAAVTSLPYNRAIPVTVGKMEVFGRRLFIRRHESQMPGEVDFLGAIDIKDPRHPIYLGEIDSAQRQLAPFSDMAFIEDGVILVGDSARIYQPNFIPMLSIKDASSNVELSWVELDSGFKVQTRSSLDATNVWSDAQAIAELVDGQNYMRLPKDGEAKFFRLLKPSN